MSAKYDEVTNFTQYVMDTLFGSNKCNSIQRIQFSCKRKQIIEKLNIFFSQNNFSMAQVFDILLEREGLFVYKCKRSAAPVRCAVSDDICHTFDEIHLISPITSSSILVRTDITDVICKLHTFIHWQSFVICTMYSSEKIDHVKLFEEFSVLLNFVNALCTHK
tara:strand:- start:10518 stop:11006 length:489 start_codon:yes stop_codon:yes gene_type:complete